MNSKIFKSVVSIFMAVMLCCASMLPAFADDWSPPERYNYVLDHNLNDSARKALSICSSNFVEAGLNYYDDFEQDLSTNLKIETVLKHIELNALADCYTDSNGQRYMKISASDFEKKSKKLFGEKINASKCPGYNNGYIYVTADNYDSAIHVFTVIEDCYALGINLYSMSFKICKTKSTSGVYGISSTDGYEIVGEGEMNFYYYGSDDAQTFNYSEFLVYFIENETSFSEYTNANLAYTVKDDQSSVKPVTPSKPNDKVVIINQENNYYDINNNIESNDNETNTEALDSYDYSDVADTYSTSSSSGSSAVIYLLIIVIIAAVAGVLIILVIKRKK